MIVNPLEYSIVQAISSGHETSKGISIALNQPLRLIQERLRYLNANNGLYRNDNYGVAKYYLSIPVNQFVIESYKVVERMRFTKTSHIDASSTAHIPDIKKDQILPLVKQGLKRTEIAKRLDISKTDLLLVMDERKISCDRFKVSYSNTIKSKKDDELKQMLIKQLEEAYLIAIDMKAEGKRNLEIAQYLNDLGYTNLFEQEFEADYVGRFFYDPPKVLKEVVKRVREREKVAQ